MTKESKIYFQKHKYSRNTSLVSYELMFVSLIPPFISAKTKFTLTSRFEESKKILVKKSYLLMTWFYYLSFTKSKGPEEAPASIAILPRRTKRYTLTKAPMAHKTNSKEQFQFAFYYYKVSMSGFLNSSKSLSTVSLGFAFGDNARSNFPFFETNLLFVKYAKIRFFFFDKNFFNYYSFLKNSKVRLSPLPNLRESV